MKQQGRGRQQRRRRRPEEPGDGGGGVLQENSSPSPNKHSRVSGRPLRLPLPENRTRNNEDAAIGATVDRSVPLPSPAQRDAEECTNKSIRADANDDASPAEVGGSSRGRPLDDDDEAQQGGQEKKRRKAATTTIVSAEEGADLRWIYCRERGCTFWTRKPGTHELYTLLPCVLMN